MNKNKEYTVITGASAGIGYEAAIRFAQADKNLILTARREEELKKLSDKIKTEVSENIDIIVKPADLSKTEETLTFYESLDSFFIETFINNAGFGDSKLVKDYNLNKLKAMLGLNVEALTLLSTLFVKDYFDKKATLINVSSVGGYNLVPNYVTYCATKYYVNAFTENLALELKKSNAKMKAKVLAPAVTKTEFVQRAKDTDGSVDHYANVKHHTAKEMADFLYQLYKSDKVVGIVDLQTYNFELRDPIFQNRY